MVEQLQFSVKGADAAIHRVTIERRSVNLSAFCTCAAAQSNEFCNHRLELLEGDIENLVSDNHDDVSVLKTWIKGSDIEVAMRELAKAKGDLRIADEKVAYCRNMLVKRMLD